MHRNLRLSFTIFYNQERSEWALEYRGNLGNAIKTYKKLDELKDFLKLRIDRIDLKENDTLKIPIIDTT